jgi:DNA-binding PadR family transcriptional regulator
MGHLRGFAEAGAVLLLAGSPAHGYELMGQLSRFGLSADAVDPGTFYRMLRRLEQEGIVQSRWSTEGSGAARRVYEITPEGRDFLRSWRVAVEVMLGHLTEFRLACDRILSEKGV